MFKVFFVSSICVFGVVAVIVHADQLREFDPYRYDAGDVNPYDIERLRGYEDWLSGRVRLSPGMRLHEMLGGRINQLGSSKLPQIGQQENQYENSRYGEFEEDFGGDFGSNPYDQSDEYRREREYQSNRERPRINQARKRLFSGLRALEGIGQGNI